MRTRRHVYRTLTIGLDTGEVEVECSGMFVPGSPEVGLCYDHGGIPADPPEIEDLSVMLGDRDLTNEIPDEQVAWIVERLIEEADAE